LESIDGASGSQREEGMAAIRMRASSHYVQFYMLFT